MKINKLSAVLLSIWFLVLLVLKGVWTKVFYPIVYLVYSWTMKGVERKNYVRHEKIFASPIKWFFWLHYDDDQPKEGPNWYREQSPVFSKYTLPLTRWQTFACAYGWNAVRNPMYNINYVYFGNSSEIVHVERAFGDYDWDRKLRSSNGDNGYQLVWFLTEKKQSRFIFSMAKYFKFIKPVMTERKWFFGLCSVPKKIVVINVPWTFYFGWNPNTNGRFTIAGKFK